MQARLTSVSIRGGDKPRTVLRFITTQPADEKQLGKTVSTRGEAGVLRACEVGSDVRFAVMGKRAVKVANPDTAQGVADVTWTVTTDEILPAWADDVNEDFVLEWEAQ